MKMIIYSSKERLFKLMFVSAVILFIGITCFKADLWIWQFVGIANILLGTIGLLVATTNLLTNKPQLILTDNGIKHQKITKKPIPWENISESKIVVENNRWFLFLKSKEDVHDKDFSFLYRTTAKVDLKNNIIKINLDSLKVDTSDLMGFLSGKITRNVG